MAWTAPKTWTVGELVTAANMNTHIRDNLNTLGPIVKIRKPADEPITSSTTFQNDNDFFFAIAANEIWIIEHHFTVSTASATPGFKCQWTTPAGATGHWWGAWYVPASTLQTSVRATLATAKSFATSADTSPFSFYVVVVNSTTAGTMQFQWAQNVSDAAATTVLTNSFLRAWRP